jgi:hypothetical protein
MPAVIQHLAAGTIGTDAELKAVPGEWRWPGVAVFGCRGRVAPVAPVVLVALGSLGNMFLK